MNHAFVTNVSSEVVSVLLWRGRVLLALLVVIALLLLFVVVARAQNPGGAAPTPLAGTGSFDVILTEIGLHKIPVIAIVREAVPGMGLADAKHLVESAPTPVKRGISQTEAQDIKRKLENAGATVLIQQGTAAAGATPTAPASMGMGAPPAGAADVDVILSEMGPNKIQVIAVVRAFVPGTGLADAKHLVESAPIPVRRGVSRAEAEDLKHKLEAAGATALIQPMAHATTTSPETGALDFEVILAEMGPNKIQVIKEIRDVLPGMGLAEAKNLVESAPTSIKRGVSKAKAEAIKQQVESAGAKVTIKPL